MSHYIKLTVPHKISHCMKLAVPRKMSHYMKVAVPHKMTRHTIFTLITVHTTGSRTVIKKIVHIVEVPGLQTKLQQSGRCFHYRKPFSPLTLRLKQVSQGCTAYVKNVYNGRQFWIGSWFRRRTDASSDQYLRQNWREVTLSPASTHVKATTPLLN